MNYHKSALVPSQCPTYLRAVFNLHRGFASPIPERILNGCQCALQFLCLRQPLSHRPGFAFWVDDQSGRSHPLVPSTDVPGTTSSPFPVLAQARPDGLAGQSYIEHSESSPLVDCDRAPVRQPPLYPTESRLSLTTAASLFGWGASLTPHKILEF